MRERPRRRRRARQPSVRGDEVCSLTPDAYRVAMLIALRLQQALEKLPEGD